jgi:hypothetical protein
VALRRVIGLLGVERDAYLAYVRWEKAATFRPLPFKIDDWRGQIHVVERAAVPDEVRAAIDLFWPAEVTPPEQAMDRAMLQSTGLTVVSDEVRAALMAAGVRVWTIGYHRNPGLLRIAAAGGRDAPPLLIEHVSLGNEVALRPIGRPAGVAWRSGAAERDRIDRLLRAVSGGLLTEATVLLAKQIDLDGWSTGTGSAEARAAIREGIAMARDPEVGEYCESLQWLGVRFFGEEVAAAEANPAVAALASADGPAEVVVMGLGRFWRELLPAEPHPITPATDPTGWLQPVPGLDGAVRPAAIELAATHRYVQEMAPGAWWELPQ